MPRNAVSTLLGYGNRAGRQCTVLRSLSTANTCCDLRVPHLSFCIWGNDNHFDLYLLPVLRSPMRRTITSLALTLFFLALLEAIVAGVLMLGDQTGRLTS